MPALTLKKLIPDNYNPFNQITTWADTMPTYNLPEGKVFILGKGPIWTADQVLNRGMTQIQHNDVSGISPSALTALKDAGKTYHSVPFTPEFIGLPATDILGEPPSGPNEWVGTYPNTYNRIYFPNGLPTYEQGYALGQRCNIDHKVTVAETKENLHYTYERADYWAGFYDAKTPRLASRHGSGYLQSHDYLFINIGPDWHNITEAQAKDYFRNLPSLPNFDYTTGSLKHCNLYTGSGYLPGIDRDNRYVFDIALKGRMYKALGKKFACYWDPEREWMPNMKNGNRGSEGILYLENKMPTPPTMTAAMVVAGLHFGVGFIGWNAGGKVVDKLWSEFYMEQLFNGSFYVKNAETLKRPWQEWPYLAEGTTYNYVKWSGNLDAAAFAAKAYADTFGQVPGGIVKAAKYKINDGPWYNPVNTFQDDLCYAKYHSQPIVETQMESGKEAVIFMDPMSTNQVKMVTVEGQTGVQHTFKAVGNTPHLGIANL